MSPLILALVVAPIATELPEKLNSVIWVRAGKDTLAMGNITGAMVFQACIPTSVGLVFAADAWRVMPGSTTSMVAFASAAFAFVSMAVIFVPLTVQGRLRGRGLLAGGAFYVAFLVFALMVGAGVS
jgi:cation:H+ antiporter